MWSSQLIDTSSGRNSLEAEASLTGVEGEWKLQGEEERARTEFAMREWGDGTGQARPSEGGQWRLEEKMTEDQMEVSRPAPERRICCCDHVTEIKIFITIFGIINLGVMASGGVGFGLGLGMHHNAEDTFKYLMVNIILGSESQVKINIPRLDQVV